MNHVKQRSLNSLGMFDLLKAVLLLMIVVDHTIEQLPFFRNGLYVIAGSLLASAFMTTGHGMRVRSMKKSIRQQRKALLLPCLLAIVFGALLHGVVHYAFFRQSKAAVTESLRIFAGFALGLPKTSVYFGKTVFSSGPLWFLFAMVAAILLTNGIELLCKERTKLKIAVVAGVSLSGWVLSVYSPFEIPFCISRAMVIVPYIFVGYTAKKQRWLERSLPAWYIVLVILCGASLVCAFCLAGQVNMISGGFWIGGPYGIVADGVIGYFLLWLFAHISQYSGRILSVLESIGAHCFELICIHSVEYNLPWYLFHDRMADKPVQAFALALLLRASFLVIVYFLVKFVKTRIRSIRLKAARV